MLVINGSLGEGGGQILRTSLALSLVTGTPFRLENIRAKRKKPGLMRQHLIGVHAAVEISQALINGDNIGSTELTFIPGESRPCNHKATVSTAGSALLVLQAVLPALATCGGPSRLVLEGGTHNPWAPPFDFLHRAYLPLLNRMGPTATMELARHGFYPAGGGQVAVVIDPVARLEPLELSERGEIRARRVRGIVANLPVHIAQREVDTVCDRLSWSDDCAEVEMVESDGPGNVVMVEIESEHVTEVFTGFGRKGVPAEQVARELAEEVRRYLEADVPVGRHLADQLVLLLALAGGGRFTTLAPTGHTSTNIEVIKMFLEVEIETTRHDRDRWEIQVT